MIAISVSGCSDGKAPDYSKEVPPLQHRVNDYADLFEKETRDSLESKLARYEEETSTQIVILTVEDIGEKSIEEYSMAVAENWKIGQKGKDNGVLITVAKEQKKVRIETGYGIEGILPDGQCWYIIEHIFLPQVKKKHKDFDAAITETVDAIIRTIGGEFQSVQKEAEDKELTTWFIVALFFVTAFIAAIGVAMENGFVSGGIGAIAYPIIYACFWSVGLFTILILAGIGFIICFIARFFIEAAAESSGGSSGYSFGGGSGGFLGGGGGFGGGGASGGW